ncbi:MAG: hypothetical protein KA318_00010 [Nitrosomonas sp.]|nr:hypothetical protein [Nitrosomonas sp.]
MTIDLAYIPEGGLTEYFVDKDTGEPLAAGIVKFWIDSNRVVSKDVYQITGAEPNYTFTSLGATLVLSSVGTFEDNLGNPVIPYYYPYDSNGDVELYYVTVESSGNIAQFTRSAWPHVDSTSVNPDVADELVAHNNLISNGTFVDVLFPEAYYPTPTSHIYTVTGSQVTSVAPGWDLVTSGAGTVTVSRVANTSIAPNDPAVVSVNPPYALRIIGSGGTLTTLTLRQRLEESPRLDANSYISAYILAAANAGSEQLTVTYDPSGGTTVTLIAAVVGSGGQYEPFNSVEAIVAPFNTDSAITGYVDIIVGLESDCDITISCVQIVSVATETIIGYNQQTTARERDFLSHYYMPQVQHKPIPSWLVGWDFPLNPLQFNGNGTVAAQAIGANKSFYAWDQTIVFQSVNSGVSISRSTGGSFVMTSTSVSPATGQVGIIQYLDRAHILPLLHDSVSVNIAAYTSAASAVTASVELYYTEDANLPAMGSNNSIVSSLNSDGSVNSTNGTWVKIPRINNLGTATFKIQPKVTEEFFDYHFNGWDLEGISATNTATYFAIVIGTEGISSPTTISFLSVGLCSGEVPTRPAPQTADQVLQECQRYYESSYPAGVAPATASQAGAIFRLQYGVDTGAQRRGYSRSFGVEYKTQKRKTPNFEIYNDNTGASNEVSPWQNVTGATATRLAGVTFLNVATPSSGNWILKGSDTKQIFYAVENSVAFFGVITADPAPEAFITFHYTADSRLGIVN